MNEDDIVDFMEMMLEDETFDEFLERFDLTPAEVFIFLIEEGMIDLRDVKELMKI
jgi:hypothetical protein